MGNFQDARERPGRQVKGVDGRFQKCVGGLVHLAVHFKVPVAHLGIAENAGSRKSPGLNVPG